MQNKTKMTFFLFFLAIVGAFVILSGAKNPLNLFRSESASAATVNSSGNVSLPSLNQGLVGWWTFDAKDMAATQVLDRSGNGQNLTATAGVLKVAGKIGQAVKTENNNYLSKSSPISITSTISTCTWLKPTRLPTSNYATVVDYGQYAEGFGLWINTSYSILWTINGNFGNPVGFTAPVSKWSHVCLTWDGSIVTAYGNGVFISTSSYVGTINPHTIVLGARTTGGEYFNGLIDDVRVYNRALSPKEIQTLYQMGGGKINKSEAVKPNLNSGLVGWWTMDGKDFSDAAHIIDKSGVSSPATIVGSATKVVGKISQGIHLNNQNNADVAHNTNYINAGTQLGNFMGTTTQISVGVWIKTPSQPINHGVFGIGNFGASYGPFQLCIVGNLYWKMNYNAFNQVVSLNLGDNKWHHIVAVYDGSSATLWVDGIVKIDHVAFSTPLSFTGLTAGIGAYYTNQYSFPGSIDDVRVYNRALSTQEVQMLYQQGGNKVNKSETTRPNLNLGLVGYWTFDGKDMTATQVIDKSGSRNNGTLTGSTKKIGKIGQGLSFNGTSDKVTLGGAPTVTGNFSLCSWINRTGNTATTRSGIIDIGSYSANTGFGLWLNVGGGDNALILRINNCSTTLCYSSGITPTLNKWENFCMIYDGSLLRLYKNGIIVYSNNIGTYNPNVVGAVKGTFGIRAENAWNTAEILDDVRIYNRALSAQEVQLLYQMGK